MYQIQLLKTKTLITPMEVIFHAATTHTIYHRSILQNIIIAEQRFIAPTIGRDLYDALTASKHTTITSGNQAAQLVLLNAYSATIEGEVYTTADIPVGTMINAMEYMSADNQTLWTEHLWKLIAECVECVTIVPSWLQHTSQGQQKNNPEVIGGSGQNSASGELREIKYKEDSYIQNRIDPLIAALEWYLCKNKTTFPLYSCVSDDDADGISIKRKSPFVIGIYDEPTSNCPE